MSFNIKFCRGGHCTEKWGEKSLDTLKAELETHLASVGIAAEVDATAHSCLSLCEGGPNLTIDGEKVSICSGSYCQAIERLIRESVDQ